MTDVWTQLPDGSLIKKSVVDLQPDDMVVFDGPNAFASIEKAYAELTEQVEAMGGLRAWQLAGLRHEWANPIKPTILTFDPKKPKPDAFACYTAMQMHEAYALGAADGFDLGAEAATVNGLQALVPSEGLEPSANGF